MRAMVSNRRTLASAAMVLATVLTSGGACASEPSGAEILNFVSVKEVRELLTHAGANVQKVDFDQDGFTITATLSPERHVWFAGMECKGVGEATACPEFKISAVWQLDTPAHANELARQLNYNYTSIFADGAELDLWRMDFTYGGITREHLRQTIVEFLDLRRKAEEVIWPPSANAKPSKPQSK
jgi:hypothetical protein